MHNRLSIPAFFLTLVLIALTSCTSPRQQTREVAAAQILVIPLQFANAEELAQELGTVLRNSQETVQANAAWMILADPRTNSLLVCVPDGSSANESTLRKLVSALDVQVKAR